MIDNKNQRPHIIAYYLPQYHPIHENDEWWGKGFTEWTNVAKARPLFKGHYQPHIPADLGFYDLRLPETRQVQADLARAHGVEGFCYWHYWFGNGKQLLDRPFNEVLASGKPDFPFCLGWANHSWKHKSWTADGTDKVLIEQTYPGLQDEEEHFRALLPAFCDKRYIRVHNRPLFMIWDPSDMPDVSAFLKHWNILARQEGIDGFHFLTIVTDLHHAKKAFELGFSSVTLDLQTDIFNHVSFLENLWHRIRRRVFHIPKCIDYGTYVHQFMSRFGATENVFPQILSNWDHSPRCGGKSTVILTDSTPAKFERFLGRLFEVLKAVPAEKNFVFIRSWNEWAEGNHLEPDLKYGLGHLDALQRQVERFSR